jgi:benzoate/toluate 1,2-dioxygenase alpha subunit
MSGVRTEDEGLFVVQHKYWQEALKHALSAEAKSRV